MDCLPTKAAPWTIHLPGNTLPGRGRAAQQSFQVQAKEVNTGGLTYGSQGQGVYLDYSDHKGQKWPWWLCLNGIRVEGHEGGLSMTEFRLSGVSCCQGKAKGQGVTLEEKSVLGPDDPESPD